MTNLWQRAQDSNERGFDLALFRIFLSILELLYGTGVWVRNVCYDLGLLHSEKPPCFVVSVGNLTVGGTGKTPIVIYIANRLQAKGRKVAVLTRGYARQGKETVRIVKVDDPAREVGDESLLLATRLHPIPVIVGKNRMRSGEWAIRNLSVDTLVLDDGFQYRKLKKDAEILLFDATNPIGNGHLLPRGILREPLGSIRRADGVLLTKIEQCEITNSRISELEGRIHAFNPGIAVARAAYIPLHIKRLGGDEVLGAGELSGKSIMAFSGIASPKSFTRTLEELGAKIVGERHFPDHHYLTPDELGELDEEASQKGAWGLVTTEKDGVRIPRIEPGTPIWLLSVEIEIRSGNDALETLLQLR
jgi:tetraacyldisaccharide 4'-kinase